MKIEIEYCAMWNYKPQADRVSEEIKQAHGIQAELVAGGGGIFEIRKNGKVIWKKLHSGHYPKEGEAAALFA